MKRRVPWALLVLVMAVGCGDDSEGDGGRPAGEISDEDAAIISRIQTDVRAWDRAAAPWVQAYGGNDAERFLRVHRRSLKPLNSAAAGIQGGALQIADTKLRRDLVPIGDAYRDQFDRIVDIGDYVLAGDYAASRSAGRALRRINRRKGELAQRLVNDFPELGREF
jgi:hypothetical protein